MKHMASVNTEPTYPSVNINTQSKNTVNSVMTFLWLLLGLAAVESTTPYQVEFEVTLSKGKKSSFTVEVYPDWAPLGADRFKEIVEAGIWKAARFFRG